MVTVNVPNMHKKTRYIIENAENIIYIANNLMHLQEFRAESKKLTNVIPRQEKYKFTIEDFRRMDAVADLDEKYVLRTGKSVGLRAEDFVEFTRGDLEPYIAQEAPICITQQGRITKKEHVPAWPFIDADAQPIIKLKLEQITVLEEVTKKAGNVKAGGLPYEQSLAKNTAKFLADVIRQTKEELNA